MEPESDVHKLQGPAITNCATTRFFNLLALNPEFKATKKCFIVYPTTQ